MIILWLPNGCDLSNPSEIMYLPSPARQKVLFHWVNSVAFPSESRETTFAAHDAIMCEVDLDNSL